MQWRWYALHRIILNKLIANIVFRCMSTQINSMQVCHTSMNKYIYRVRFVTLKFLYIAEFTERSFTSLDVVSAYVLVTAAVILAEFFYQNGRATIIVRCSKKFI